MTHTGITAPHLRKLNFKCKFNSLEAGRCTEDEGIVLQYLPLARCVATHPAVEI